jgi:bifunctional non-homologous end joining protein LigD
MISPSAFSLPHPERVLFPQLGVTRAMLAAYYAAMAPYLLPHLRGRAITVRRWPKGVTGPSFYQKHPAPRRPSAPEAAAQRWIAIDTVDELVRWVGLGAIEFHVSLGPADQPHLHDWAVMDLDPNPPAGWPAVRQAAQAVARLLERLELPYRLKTSGGQGVHFYIPVAPGDPRVLTACMEALARLTAAALPDLTTVTRRVAERGGRVYLDYLQNGQHRTMAAVYGVRATPSASVSTPITLAELGFSPEHWTMERVLDRVARAGDRFAWTGARVDLPQRLAAWGLMPGRRSAAPDGGGR